MANTLLTPSIIAKEALFQLENNVIMGNLVHRQYKDEFVKIGESVTIRKPVKFVASDGVTRVNQDVIEDSTSLTVDQRKHVSWSFSSQDLTMTIDEYSERYIKPAMITLANTIDVALLKEGAEAFHNVVGTVGETLNDYQTLADAAQRMDEGSVPDDGNRCLVVRPASRWGLAAELGSRGNTGIDNPDMVADFIRKGYLGNLANFDIYGDQNVQALTNGIYTGTPLVNGTVSEGDSSIPTDGGTASTTDYFRKGDIITFAGVNAVNDVSKDDLGYLKQFVVTADTDTGAGGAANIPVYPPMYASTTDGRQNVTALPADNAAISNVTAASATETSTFHDLAFHHNALALVTCPLELPDSATFKARAEWNGFSIRLVKAYDIDSDEEIIRLDIFFGVKGIYPELGVKVQGGAA